MLVGRADASAFRSGSPVSVPVVLIPGVYESWQLMRPLAAVLHGAGHPVHVVRALRFNKGTFEEMAGLVDAYLVEQGLDCVVVAHSKGGLTGKYLMVAMPRGERVVGLVTINTPFGGSR